MMHQRARGGIGRRQLLSVSDRENKRELAGKDTKEVKPIDVLGAVTACVYACVRACQHHIQHPHSSACYICAQP